MDLNEFEQIISKEEHVIVFGYGDFGIWMIGYLRERFPNISVEACDNDKEKCGKFDGVRVTSVSEAVNLYKESLFVLSAVYRKKDMTSQLESLGVEDRRIIVDLPEELETKKRWFKEQYRITPMEAFHFDVDIARHCNLNCRSCAHFSPLSGEEYYDCIQFENDVTRLGELFDHKAWRIQILGGEPLLNKNVCKYLEVARKEFPQALILLITNGILLDNMEEAFWDVCKRNSIVISMTRYPIRVKYDELCNFMDNKGVSYRYYGSYGGKGEKEEFTLYPLDLDGKQNAEDNFRNCILANRCINLKKGRLFTCSTIPNIDIFNKYYGLELPVSDDDSIDIYHACSSKEITEFLSRPVPFCSYCDVKNRRSQVFGISKKDIREWTI
ncbi:4Fe-4S cluster-binding domain-containing protein [Butyrivibrio sp. AE2032]|uniref:4Fe-4S cluster-binding domain-containing protein n=1 Tax=Butyrivibrio sp. AE2032 TaxID=1458463 RepID=UPI00068E1A5D|nr:4Fe-4S cluster-binding domain-containing protein [Butyrivibrio sp. AE2032]